MGLFSKGNPYGEYMAPQYLKILKESVDIFNVTKNPDTFFQRYALAEEHADNLCKLKGVKFTGQQPKEIKQQLHMKKQAAIHDMINRYYNDTVQKASKLKTSNAKIGKYAIFISTLEDYYYLMNEDNINYINKLYNNSIANISQ